MTPFDPVVVLQATVEAFRGAGLDRTGAFRALAGAVAA